MVVVEVVVAGIPYVETISAKYNPIRFKIYVIIFLIATGVCSAKCRSNFFSIPTKLSFHWNMQKKLAIDRPRLCVVFPLMEIGSSTTKVKKRELYFLSDWLCFDFLAFYYQIC